MLPSMSVWEKELDANEVEMASAVSKTSTYESSATRYRGM